MTTYEEVAASAGLSSCKTRRFLRYMRGRSWHNEEASQCATGYAREWAERFLRGIEYEMPDEEGQALLDNMAHENIASILHDDIDAYKRDRDANAD